MINKIKRAFTLTEVLIAVAIVGVIAALVLPTIITRYQNRVMEYMSERQLQSIKSAMATLTVTENKSSFADTMMAQPSGDETSGRFLKKYLRVARYFGTPESGECDAFAPLYYRVVDERKTGGKLKRVQVNRAGLGLEGSCAQLKNGISLCLTTQSAGSARVIMDLNGPKAPNVIGRDLIEWQDLPKIYFKDLDRVSDNKIVAEDKVPIEAQELGECTSLISDYSTSCCKWKKNNNLIKDISDVCCNNATVGPTVTACFSTVTVDLNYYPTSWSSGVKPWIGDYGNKVNPASALENFPSALSVKIRCGDGSYQGGLLSGSAIKSAIKSGNKAYWPYSVSNSSCVYNNQKLLWENGDTITTVNGVKYELKSH